MHFVKSDNNQSFQLCNFCEFLIDLFCPMQMQMYSMARLYPVMFWQYTAALQVS